MTPNSRSYLNRFTQPDTLVPTTQGVQAWDRFSYVNNNPLRFTDPTGHGVDCGIGMGCVSPYVMPSGGNNNSSKDKRGNTNNSTIRIGFGMFNENGVPEGTAGLGTVIHNDDGYTIIVTALHVSGPGSYFFYRTGDDAHINILSVNDVETYPLGFRDVMIIHLPMELPKEFVPAEMASYEFQGGENVSVAYQDSNRDIHLLETQVRDDPIKPGQYSGSGIAVNNPSGILNHGDSGGGVFYNGYLVGVNSYIWSDELGPYMVFAQP